jgi:hypothetical protein
MQLGLTRKYGPVQAKVIAENLLAYKGFFRVFQGRRGPDSKPGFLPLRPRGIPASEWPRPACRAAAQERRCARLGVTLPAAIADALNRLVEALPAAPIAAAALAA